MQIEMYDDPISTEEQMALIQRERAYVHAAVYILLNNPDFASEHIFLESLLDKIQRTYRYRTRLLVDKNEAEREALKNSSGSVDKLRSSLAPGFAALDSQLSELSLLRAKK